MVNTVVDCLGDPSGIEKLIGAAAAHIELRAAVVAPGGVTERRVRPALVEPEKLQPEPLRVVFDFVGQRARFLRCQLGVDALVFIDRAHGSGIGGKVTRVELGGVGYWLAVPGAMCAAMSAHGPRVQAPPASA